MYPFLGVAFPNQASSLKARSSTGAPAAARPQERHIIICAVLAAWFGGLDVKGFLIWSQKELRFKPPTKGNFKNKARYMCAQKSTTNQDPQPEGPPIVICDCLRTPSAAPAKACNQRSLAESNLCLFSYVLLRMRVQVPFGTNWPVEIETTACSTNQEPSNLVGSRRHARVAPGSPHALTGTHEKKQVITTRPTRQFLPGRR